MKKFTFVIPLLLSGCISVTPIMTPDKKDGFVIKSTQSAVCYNEAYSQCKGRFTIIDKRLETLLQPAILIVECDQSTQGEYSDSDIIP